MSLMTSMWTAVSGLTTSQSGLTTTAHNLSNVNTDGYTRQISTSTDSNYNQIGVSGNLYAIGTGTTVAYTRQLRNDFYDASYRKENSREGFYQAQYETINEIEDLFGEMEGVSFQDTLENIWESMQELSKEPESLTARATLVNNASDFITRAQDIYDQLEAYQEDVNTTIEETVDRINELGEKIYELNVNITSVEAAGIERANDYRDERNQYLDELSNLINISYSETANGAVQVIAEGTLFISDMSASKIVLKESDGNFKMRIPVWEKLDEEVFNPVKFQNMSDYQDSGYLKGLIIARGTETANYTDMPIEPEAPEYPLRTDYTTVDQTTGVASFDSQAYNAAVTQYNTDYDAYKTKMNIYTNEVNTYNSTVGVSSIMSIMCEFDNLVNGIVTQINDTISPNKEIEIINADGSISIMTVLDEDKAPVGMDNEKTQGEELFKRKQVERYVDVQVTTYKTDSEGNKVYDAGGNPITETKTVRQYQQPREDKKSTQYTLGELEINQNITDNYSILALSDNSGSGDYTYGGVVADLIDIWDQPFTTLDPNTLTTYTFGEYYNAMIGDLGNVGQTMSDMMDNQKSLSEEIQNSRDNYSGVSSDEELSNLMKFQHAYNAASRYFNVINDMMESVIGIVG